MSSGFAPKSTKAESSISPAIPAWQSKYNAFVIKIPHSLYFLAYE